MNGINTTAAAELYGPCEIIQIDDNFLLYDRVNHGEGDYGDAALISIFDSTTADGVNAEISEQLEQVELFRETLFPDGDDPVCDDVPECW